MSAADPFAEVLPRGYVLSGSLHVPPPPQAFSFQMNGFKMKLYSYIPWGLQWEDTLQDTFLIVSMVSVWFLFSAAKIFNTVVASAKTTESILLAHQALENPENKIHNRGYDFTNN